MRDKDLERRLNVYLRNDLVGRLWLDEGRRLVFQYDSGWLKRKSPVPLSLSLPLKADPYLEDAARPFFSNLLPEAGIRQTLARRLRISEQNDFDLLREIGGECAGAVSVLPEGLSPAVAPGYRELDEEELHRVVKELPRRPFLVGDKGARLSLAGAQNKLPVYMEGDRVFLASGNAPSTHILKPPIAGLEESVENEAFCMTLAAQMELAVPKARIRQGHDRLYIVERYDREHSREGEILRLHQEDFCQALGILPEQKYEAEGGPSLARCFALIKEKSAAPAVDQRALFLWVVFNMLIGNADAHAKNLAILFTPAGPRLAPFYDLISTLVYPDLSARLAMRIGGENRVSWIQRRHWERFSREVGIKPRWIERNVREIALRISPLAEAVARDFIQTYGPSAVVEKLLQIINKASSRFAGSA
jgi:serine/threonine-protein kinase HipA